MKILKHIVMWKFLDNAEGKTKAENMRFAAENLRALVGVAPTLLKLSIGEDVLGSPASFDMALVADFKSVEDMLAYRDFPRHAEISNYIRRVISDRKVVDFFIETDENGTKAPSVENDAERLHQNNPHYPQVRVDNTSEQCKNVDNLPESGSFLQKMPVKRGFECG